MKTKKLTMDQILALCQEYQNGKSIKSLAKVYSLSTETVHRYLKANNIARRPKGTPKGTCRVLDKQQCLALVQKYQAGSTISDLANEFSVNWLTARRVLIARDAQIFRRRRQRLYSVNDEFFSDIQTEEQAYWLGFLAADGYIRKRGHFTPCVGILLAGSDKGHLLKFRKALASTYPVHLHKSGYAVIEVASRHLATDLARYGIDNPKNLHFPLAIPEPLYRHFIRGLVDGDGCWRLAGPRFLLAGPPKFVSDIQQYLMQKCNLSQTRPGQMGKIWEIRYGGGRQVARIAHFLYDGASIWLDRKFQLVQELL